jgi:hypothetical protein
MRKLGVIGGICGILALVLTLLGPAGAGTTHLWSDTGSSPFSTEIDRIGRAGCASGFADGTFRPRDQVTRQQFAFWMNHCGGRFAHGSGSLDVQPSANPTSIVRIILEPGAVDTGLAVGGWVLVQGAVEVSAPAAQAAACPCDVSAWAADDTHGMSSTPVHGTLGAAADESGRVRTTLAVNEYFAVPPGGPTAYELRARYDDDENPVITFTADLTVIYVPFGADGGSNANAT